MRVVGEPRFKPGDQVTIRSGRGIVWTILAVGLNFHFGIGYLVTNDKRERTVAESALIPWSMQMTA